MSLDLGCRNYTYKKQLVPTNYIGNHYSPFISFHAEIFDIPLRLMIIRVNRNKTPLLCSTRHRTR